MNTIAKTTDLYFKYVPHEEIQSWEKLGWFDHHSFKDCHHGIYSTLCQWQGIGEPVYPEGFKSQGRHDARPRSNSEPVEPQS